MSFPVKLQEVWYFRELKHVLPTLLALMISKLHDFLPSLFNNPFANCSMKWSVWYPYNASLSIAFYQYEPVCLNICFQCQSFCYFHLGIPILMVTFYLLVITGGHLHCITFTCNTNVSRCPNCNLVPCLSFVILAYQSHSSSPDSPLC